MNLPDFDNPDWDAERKRLQDILSDAAIALVAHMGGPGGIRGTFNIEDASGRSITLTLEADARPKGH